MIRVRPGLVDVVGDVWVSVVVPEVHELGLESRLDFVLVSTKGTHNGRQMHTRQWSWWNIDVPYPSNSEPFVGGKPPDSPSSSAFGTGTTALFPSVGVSAVCASKFATNLPAKISFQTVSGESGLSSMMVSLLSKTTETSGTEVGGLEFACTCDWHH